jgi:hypothetical protein
MAQMEVLGASVERQFGHCTLRISLAERKPSQRLPLGAEGLEHQRNGHELGRKSEAFVAVARVGVDEDRAGRWENLIVKRLVGEQDSFILSDPERPEAAATGAGTAGHFPMGRVTVTGGPHGGSDLIDNRLRDGMDTVVHGALWSDGDCTLRTPARAGDPSFAPKLAAWRDRIRGLTGCFG